LNASKRQKRYCGKPLRRILHNLDVAFTISWPNISA
jgi:hypothetical protein